MAKKPEEKGSLSRASYESQYSPEELEAAKSKVGMRALVLLTRARKGQISLDKEALDGLKKVVLGKSELENAINQVRGYTPDAQMMAMDLKPIESSGDNKYILPSTDYPGYGHFSQTPNYRPSLKGYTPRAGITEGPPVKQLKPTSGTDFTRFARSDSSGYWSKAAMNELRNRVSIKARQIAKAYDDKGYKVPRDIQRVAQSKVRGDTELSLWGMRNAILPYVPNNEKAIYGVTFEDLREAPPEEIGFVSGNIDKDPGDFKPNKDAVWLPTKKEKEEKQIKEEEEKQVVAPAPPAATIEDVIVEPAKPKPAVVEEEVSPTPTTQPTPAAPRRTVEDLTGIGKNVEPEPTGLDRVTDEQIINGMVPKKQLVVPREERPATVISTSEAVRAEKERRGALARKEDAAAAEARERAVWVETLRERSRKRRGL